LKELPLQIANDPLRIYALSKKCLTAHPEQENLKVTESISRIGQAEKQRRKNAHRRARPVPAPAAFATVSLKRLVAGWLAIRSSGGGSAYWCA
jgi:hypothetical protein